MKSPLPLDDGCRSDLYTGFAHGLGAGLSPEHTLNAVGDVCGGALTAPLARARNAVRKGTALSLALAQQGLVPELDRALVHAGEDSGRIHLVFERLAERYQRSHARWQTMKSRLMLPAFILVFAILVLPIPALFAGRISAGEYVFTTVQLLVLIALTVLVVRRLVQRWRSHGPPTIATRIARLMPLVARLSRLHERARAIESLAINLASGVPARDALSHMHGATDNEVHRVNLVRARSALEGGMPLADSLLEAGLVDAREGFAIIGTGEQAGKLDSVLARYARSCHDKLDDVYDVLAQWIPIVVYFAVAGVVAAGILG